MESEGKFSTRYRDAVAVIELNPDVYRELGSPKRVKVRSAFGEVVVKAMPSDRVPPDRAYMPMGPWANALVDPSTESTGMPNFKSTKVVVEPTDEEITDILTLLHRYSSKISSVKPAEKPLSGGPKRVVEDFVCPFCGLLCDYIKLEIEGDRIVKNIGGCAISVAKTLNHHKDRILKPMVRKNGELVETSLEEAIDRAAEILAKARYPLLYGWSSTSVEAIELGLELAEVVRGVIDNTSTVCHGPTAMAIQETGTVRMTLGLIKHLADVVVFWGCNPLEAHPNFFRRLVEAEGRKVSGRKDRKIIVIDVRKTPTAARADLFIQIEPGRDYEFITALRMAIKDLEIEAPVVAGVPREKIIELAEILRSARYGVILFGMGVTMTGAKFRNIEEVIKLVQDLNEYTRFSLLAMRGHYNVTGANASKLWTTGYPYAVDFSRGYPRFLPGYTTTVDLLSRGEVDAVLVVASDPVAHLPWKAVQHLAKVPLIVIDPKWSLTAALADVVIPSAITGIECEGTAYRMDGVAIKLKKVVDPPPGVLPDTEILRMILEKVKKLKGLS